MKLAEPFQSCLDSIPGAVFQIVTSFEGLVLSYPYIGDGCYKLLETSRPLAVTSGKLFEALYIEDRAHFGLALAHAVKTPHLWTWKGRILLANGKIKWISLTVQPVVSQLAACSLPTTTSDSA